MRLISQFTQPSHEFTFKSLSPLFFVQFFAGFNDNVLRNTILVLVTFSSVRIFGISPGVLVNLAVFLFIVPFLLFSSYAGKLADIYNKVRIVRIVKSCEVLIVMLAGYSLYTNSFGLLLLMLFAMGMHTTFFSPIKYAILPQYYASEQVGIATAYIELGTFISILLGQTFGSWAMASHWVNIIILTMFCTSLIGLAYSFKLKDVPVSPDKPKFYLNPLLDSWLMFKRVTHLPVGVKLNLHIISWFWAMGLINTTEFSLFTLKYLGGDGHLFSLILALISIGIGIGSIICAKLSHGKIVHGYVIFGGLAISVVMWGILFSHSDLAMKVSFHDFLCSIGGQIFLVAVFIKSICAGFYSLTCYTELQLIANANFRSQVIAANNILNALYMVATAVVCSILQLFLTAWGVLFTASLLNVGLMLIYGIQVKKIAKAQ